MYVVEYEVVLTWEICYDDGSEPVTGYGEAKFRMGSLQLRILATDLSKKLKSITIKVRVTKVTYT